MKSVTERAPRPARACSQGSQASRVRLVIVHFHSQLERPGGGWMPGGRPNHFIVAPGGHEFRENNGALFAFLQSGSRRARCRLPLTSRKRVSVPPLYSFDDQQRSQLRARIQRIVAGTLRMKLNPRLREFRVAGQRHTIEPRAAIVRIPKLHRRNRDFAAEFACRPRSRFAECASAH